MTTQYDWSKAPDWAEWAATDFNGEVCFYAARPYCRIEYGNWLPNFFNKEYEVLERPLSTTKTDWKESLEKRP